MHYPPGFNLESEFDSLLSKYSSNTIYVGISIPTAQHGAHVQVFVDYICGTGFVEMALHLQALGLLHFYVVHLNLN